ncbi:unnamed protein product [Amoebophrya sp. A120]|nr:unnamed protein product [Amoebophrya sp. A120]|eukprot:GSA120T00002140001.1
MLKWQLSHFAERSCSRFARWVLLCAGACCVFVVGRVEGNTISQESEPQLSSSPDKTKTYELSERSGSELGNSAREEVSTRQEQLLATRLLSKPGHQDAGDLEAFDESRPASASGTDGEAKSSTEPFALSTTAHQIHGHETELQLDFSHHTFLEQRSDENPDSAVGPRREEDADAASAATGEASVSALQAVRLDDEQTAPKQQLSVEQQLAQLGVSVASLQASETSLRSLVTTLQTSQTSLTRTVADLERENRDLRAMVTSCNHDLKGVEENSRRGFRTVRDLLAFLEIVIEWILTYLFALSKLEYTFTMFFLTMGYISVLIAIVLPTKLVFFPLTYVRANGADEVLPPDVVQRELPRNHEVLAAISDNKTRQEDTTEEKELPSTESKYYVLPWDFFDRGTLSSVTQRSDSSEGRIFTTCMIINQICVILSHYTVTVYDRECASATYNPRGESVVWRNEDEGNDFLYLVAPQTERVWHLALRVVWLVVPHVLILIAAAIPSSTYDQKSNEADTVHAAREDDATGEDAVAPTREQRPVSELHEMKTRKYERALHSVVAFAMFLLLLFETRQLVWSENVNLRMVLFGLTSSERLLAGEELERSFNALAHAQSAFCGNHKMQVAAMQKYPWEYFPRALFLVLGWLLSLLFLGLAMTLVLFRHTSAGSGGSTGRLVPHTASLLLPRSAYVAEVLSMLVVFSLPFWAFLQEVERDDVQSSYVGNPGVVFGRSRKRLFGTISAAVRTLMDSGYAWIPSCGTWADFLAPFFTSDTVQEGQCIHDMLRTNYWWELPYREAFNTTYWEQGTVEDHWWSDYRSQDRWR